MEDPTHDNVAPVIGFEAFLREEHATEREQSMTLLEALKLYAKAVLWSMIVSSTLIMESYSLAIVNIMSASPVFNAKFGTETAHGYWTISQAWWIVLTNAPRIGAIIGLLITGQISERLGCRRTMTGALLALCLILFLFFTAVNIQMILAAQVLSGIAWGVFQILPAVYASEVCPTVLRPHVTTFINLCWIIGQFMATGVLLGASWSTTPLAYQIPFGMQWLWIPLAVVNIWVAPESPWWYVRNGDLEEARRALQRLTSSDYSPADIEETLVMMQHTNELERSHVAGTSYLDCFKGTNLRRTEIVCLVWMVQVLCGSVLVSHFNQFRQQVGIETLGLLPESGFQFLFGFLGGVGSWVLISVSGRRRLHIFGLTGLFLSLVILGSLGFAPSSDEAAKGAMEFFHSVLICFFDFIIGPVTWALVSELPSTRLKAKTMALARVLWNISNIAVHILSYSMMGVKAWNWGAKTAYFWAGICLCCLVWSYFRLPEPRGRAYKELDLLFERGVSARKFSETRVDATEAELQRMQGVERG
ncbi:MFS maltose permease [Penicillium herquei]|nr:MFS maltose permease [Penicillium herquei]